MRWIAAIALVLAGGALAADSAAAADAPNPFAAAGVTAEDARHAFNDLQNAVRANDASAVADLVAFPLRVNLPDGRTRTIADRKVFLVEYPLLFDDKLRAVVLEATIDRLSASAYGIMFGRGELWMRSVCEHSGCSDPQLRIIALNES